MNYNIKAKPTIYKGRLYRSRLESRWAAFFDKMEWYYEYEPFDLNGWSPDFRIVTSRNIEWLVEVKPTIEFVINAIPKIKRASAPIKTNINSQFSEEQEIYIWEPVDYEYPLDLRMIDGDCRIIDFPDIDIIAASREVLQMDMSEIKRGVDNDEMLLTDLAHHSCGLMIWKVRLIRNGIVTISIEGVVS